MRALILIALLASAAAQAEPTSWQGVAKEGQQALRSGHYDRARALFDDGLGEAKDAGDETWMAKFGFYLGNANLVEATETDNTALSERAAADYRAVLELRPKSGSAMVNLARALAHGGKDSEATDWYERAIATGGKKEGLYRKQYAEFLEQRDPEESARQWEQVLAAQPRSVKAHRQLVSSYKDPKYAERLPAYLMQQVKKGEVLRAQEAALDALGDPDWPAQHKDDLMNVLGASLAGQHVDPRAFRTSATAAKLRRIAAADSTLRVCIDELMETFGRRSGRVNYTWWTASEKRAGTLSKLLRSLAHTYKQAGNARRAEALYRSAVELRGARDPKALLDLLGFYSERGDIDDINRVSREYEYKLFEGKGDAYRAGDLPAIYDYHRTLAAIYANQAMRTGDWGLASRSNSAAFQLKHAYETAKRADGITPDAQLVDHLARSYAAAGDLTAANNVRLEAASEFKRSGDTAAMAAVLRPLNVGQLSDASRDRYEQLRRARPAPAINLSDPAYPKDAKPIEARDPD